MQHIYKTSWKTSLKANLSPIYLLYPVHQACVTVVCIKLVNQIYEIFHKMDKKKKKKSLPPSHYNDHARTLYPQCS